MKEERNIQACQVGPHFFDIVSTIPNWSIETLLPSLKPFLLTLEELKKKAPKMMFTLTVEQES